MMGLYGNYIPDNAVLPYHKFKKREGEQRLLQETYEQEAKLMMGIYNLYDPNIQTLFTGETLGDVMYSTWKSNYYESIVPIFYDIIISIREKISNSGVISVNLVNLFTHVFEDSENKISEASVNAYCKSFDDWIDMLGIADKKEYFYVPDPLLVLLSSDKDDIKGLAEIIYEGGVKKVC